MHCVTQISKALSSDYKQQTSSIMYQALRKRRKCFKPQTCPSLVVICRKPLTVPTSYAPEVLEVSRCRLSGAPGSLTHPRSRGNRLGLVVARCGGYKRWHVEKGRNAVRQHPMKAQIGGCCYSLKAGNAWHYLS